MVQRVAGIAIPDSAMARAATELVCHCESEIFFHHSLRVFLFAALLGNRRNLAFDSELLYICALFHDVGLTSGYGNSKRRFEVDSANAARNFLEKYDIEECDAAEVWEAIALHMSFGIAEHMTPLISLLAAGIEADLFAKHRKKFSTSELDEVLMFYPREDRFEEAIIDAMAQGMAHRPASTFGTIQADILERVDPNYRRTNFCGLVLGSRWRS